jgi:WD40 repeat protein
MGDNHAMSLIMNCPECGRPLSVPERAQGKQARCPRCPAVFQISAAPAPSPPTTSAITQAPAAGSPTLAPLSGNASRPTSHREDAAEEEQVPWAEGVEAEPWVFPLIVRHDPAGKVKGVWHGCVTGEGLRLSRKNRPDILIRVGAAARYLEGNRLKVCWGDRDVELAVTGFAFYQQTLARDLCQFLNGERTPLDKRKYAIPPTLYLPALLPLGIPILTLGGAVWAGLAGGLSAACLALVRKEQWSPTARVLLSLLLSIAGYAVVGCLLLVTFLAREKQRPVPVAGTATPPPQAFFPPNGAPRGPGDLPPWQPQRQPENLPLLPPQRQPENVPPPPPPKKPGELRTLKIKAGEVWHARFSPDGQTLATLGNEGFCQVWDRNTGEERGSFQLDNKQHNNWLVFSPTGEHLVAWDGSGMIYLREGATGKIVTRLDPGGWDAGYNWGDFAPDGKTLVVNRGGFIFFWKVPEGERITPKVKELTPLQTHNTSSHYAPDGQTIVVGAYGNPRGALERGDRVIDLTGAQPPRRLRGFDQTNMWARLTLSPDRRLAMIHSDKIVELLDWSTDKIALLLEAKGSPFRQVTFTPDSKVLVTLHLDSWVRFWEIPSGRELVGFDASKLGKALSAVGVSPDGKLLATGGGDEVTLWDLPTVFPRKGP